MLSIAKKIKETKKVYAVHGSMIFFSKKYFLKGGIIDDGFKLYCEELSTAEISKKIGCDIYYIPNIKVLHNEHSNTNKIGKYELFKLAKESHWYFIKKYFLK